MKLGEALTRRSDLQARVAELRTRMKQSARVQEGEKPHEDPVSLLAEFEAVADELERLVARINHTNLAAKLADGRSLTDALARRDSLTLRHETLRVLAEAAAERQDRYSRSEIKMLSTIEVAKLRQQADDLARERRELDVAMQEANWANELSKTECELVAAMTDGWRVPRPATPSRHPAVPGAGTWGSIPQQAQRSARHRASLTGQADRYYQVQSSS